MNKVERLKIKEVIRYKQEEEKYDKLVMLRAFQTAAFSVTTAISTARICTSDDNKLIGCIAAGISALTAILSASSLKDEVNNRRRVRDNMSNLLDDMDNENDNVTKRQYTRQISLNR